MSNLNFTGQLRSRPNEILDLTPIANGVLHDYYRGSKISPREARHRLDYLIWSKRDALVRRGWSYPRAIEFVLARVKWARETEGYWSPYPIPGLANLGIPDEPWEPSSDLPF